ncbi:hypothetical protein K435DRAFT_971863 [Dendrothele bispora CBS 962.96]|uniref:CoA-dependent acyltransferase n=1 Tax=Dendrothele bispora (strain CBS 962.96) TaxID=1314807 RepID=A0A4S8L2Y4_DENBC|nr:hypothetical protein K435DRAFT_971863 [Dendrothele bispora CBS 962.96]
MSLTQLEPPSDLLRVIGLDFTLSTDGTQYIRRLHGRERLSATNSAFNEGVLQQYAIMELTFKEPMSQQQLCMHVRAAWIKLRFHAPWIALRCHSLDQYDDPSVEANSFYFSYDNTSRKDPVHLSDTKTKHPVDILESWAEESIIFRSEVFTLEEWEVVFKNVYWHPGQGHFGMELHVAKGVDDTQWVFLFSVPHWTTDGRGFFYVSDMFLKNFTKEIEAFRNPNSGCVAYNNLPWGEEISRLMPSAVLMLPHVDVNTSQSMNHDTPKQIQFARPLIHIQSIPASIDTEVVTDTLLTKILLSPSSTRSILYACKLAKCTFTALINSILVLADVETTLRTFMNTRPKGVEPERLLRSVQNSWNTADVWCVPVNVADMRAHMYPRYAALHGSSATGGIMNVLFPTYHSMTNIRQCLRVTNWNSQTENIPDSKVKPEATKQSKTSVSIHRAWYENPKYFWEGMVKETQNLLKAGAVQPPRAFHVSSLNAESLCSQLSPQATESITGTGGVVASSLGSLQRLGIYSDFSLTRELEDQGSIQGTSLPFVMTNLACGLRSSGSPSIIVHSWEYNGRLVVSLQGSRKWQSDEMWRTFEAAVREGLHRILEEVRTATGGESREEIDLKAGEREKMKAVL